MGSGREVEPGGSVHEIFEHVGGTPIRIEILRAISDEPFELRGLSERLSAPRTTLRHNLRKMIEMDLVEETVDHEYRSTPLGEAVLGGFDRFERHVSTALRLEPLFSCLSPSRLDVDLCRLSDVSVTGATRAKPYAPHWRLERLVSDATRLRMAVPTNPFLFDRSDESIFRESSREVALYVTEDVAEVLRAEWQTELEAVEGREGIELGVLDGEALDYGVARIDERAIVLGLDETGKPHTLVETTDEAGLDWAADRLDGLRATAAQFTASTGATHGESANN